MFPTIPERYRYEECMEPVRAKFAANRTVATLQAPDTNPLLLELFLIYFTATGVAMTEPVQDWIRRAGERCEQIGLRELGRALRLHSNHEAGHHFMLMEDTRVLVDRWNVRQPVALDADLILSRQMTEGVRRYRALHENGIAGDAPFSQLAIEYEIEGLSVRLGPWLISRCTNVLGPTVTAGLRFLRHHVSLDIGHTRFNQGQLDHLLRERPECLGALVRAGEGALQAYGMFLDDCRLLAESQMRRHS
jgi:hypothetical protein